jgi:hypothetical protein
MKVRFYHCVGSDLCARVFFIVFSHMRFYIKVQGTMDNVLVIIALFAPHPWLILVARDTRSWEKLIYW